MAKPRKLKVFRTPVGFHDAYVAAPSQKAALQAWGTDTNLFARGAAEQVTDPELTKEPLARPGEVIRRLRGSDEEQIAALGKAGTGAAKTRTSPASGKGGQKKPPKPSRDQLDQAEGRLKEAEERQRAEVRAIDKKIESLERRRRETQRRHESERDELATERDRARRAYDRAMRKWERDG